jgi:integrase
VDEGHLTEDITAGLSVRVPTGAPRDLSTDEVGRLLAVAPDDRGVLVLMLMVHCGLRCSDVARIRIEDLDDRRQLLAVRAKGGRGEVTHTVPVPDEAWALVELQRSRLARWSGPLIENQRRAGHPIEGPTISRMVRTWCRAAGLKRSPWDGVSAHALRHTMAQQVLDRGATLREVQFALGHATSRSTELYLRREPPGLRAALEGRRYAA